MKNENSRILAAIEEWHRNPRQLHNKVYYSTLKGVPRTPEVRAKISKGHIGLKHDITVKFQISLTLRKMKITRSPETRKKQGAANIGRQAWKFRKTHGRYKKPITLCS